MRNDVEAVAQIVAKAARGDLAGQRTIGGGDDPRIDASARPTHPAAALRLPAACAAAWPARARRARRPRRETACRPAPPRTGRARSATAPVKAPRVWPNSSASTRSSASAAQLSAQNRRSRRMLPRVNGARDQLLARSALAFDHHRERRRRGRDDACRTVSMRRCRRRARGIRPSAAAGVRQPLARPRAPPAPRRWQRGRAAGDVLRHHRHAIAQRHHSAPTTVGAVANRPRGFHRLSVRRRRARRRRCRGRAARPRAARRRRNGAGVAIDVRPVAIRDHERHARGRSDVADERADARQRELRRLRCPGRSAARRGSASTIAGSVRGSCASRLICARSAPASRGLDRRERARAPRAAAAGAISASGQRASCAAPDRAGADSRCPTARPPPRRRAGPPSLSVPARSISEPACLDTIRGRAARARAAARRDEPRPPWRRLVTRAHDQVRARVLRRQPEQRQRRVGRQPACRSQTRRCDRSLSQDGQRQRACDSTAPSASAAIGTKPASRASRASSALGQQPTSRPTARRDRARADAPSRASASAARNASQRVVADRRRATAPASALPHFDARCAAHVEIDQPRSPRAPRTAAAARPRVGGARASESTRRWRDPGARPPATR